MRRPIENKPPNHERWIISYADFTTLLLATFVVMYAVSSVNSSKFQQMSEAFSTAFMGKEIKIQSSGLAAGHKAPFENMPSPVHAPIITREPQVKNLPPALRQQVERQAEKLNEAYEKLKALLAGMISKGEVRVSLQSVGVVVDINAVVLFDSAQADLTPAAVSMIEQVADILKELNYPIQINGFTDNAPIRTAQFSSNWDLSAARAISVVKRFVEGGIDPSLLVGAGYGEYHPVATNDTSEGKAMNRRVSIVVVSRLQDQDIMQTPIIGAPQQLVPQTPSAGGVGPSVPARSAFKGPAAVCGADAGGGLC
ncbi:MAG: OmpA family protein [Alphaproteobacteria bacterium]|nr:OmpA family protein [Alphaproteobacteria bacterium]